MAKKLKKLNNTVMAPFRAKIGSWRKKKGENKKLSFRSVSTRRGKEKAKKKSKKIKKLRNTIMATFQTKIVWKRPRKRQNKNYRFVPFLPVA